MFLEIEKIRQASAYLADKIPNLYTTKFLKLFYYFDFISVLERGVSATNDIYYHLPYGPVPSFIKDQLFLLKENGKTVNSELMEVNSEDFESVLSDVVDMENIHGTDRYIVKQKSGYQENLSHLSNYEKGLLDDLIKEFRGISTTDIVNKTHHEVPYEQTPENDVIDYGLAFYLDRDKILPQRTYDFDTELSQVEFFNRR